MIRGRNVGAEVGEASGWTWTGTLPYTLGSVGCATILVYVTLSASLPGGSLSRGQGEWSDDC